MTDQEKSVVDFLEAVIRVVNTTIIATIDPPR
jgi:hypothetical protein